MCSVWWHLKVLFSLIFQLPVYYLKPFFSLLTYSDRYELEKGKNTALPLVKWRFLQVVCLSCDLCKAVTAVSISWLLPSVVFSCVCEVTGEMKSLSVSLNFCLFFGLTEEGFTVKFQMCSCYCLFIMVLLLPSSPGQYIFWDTTTYLKLIDCVKKLKWGQNSCILPVWNSPS